MNRMKKLAVVMMLGIGMSLVGLAAADDDKEKLDDKGFARKVSACGLAEVNLSELAVRFAHNPDVKRFAQRMVMDHKQANLQLTRLANARSIKLPAEMDEKHQKLYDKLKGLQGEEFDKCYMEAMVKDHEEAVKLFENQAKDGKDADLKKMAADLEPTLKEHLEMARKLCKTVKGDKESDKDNKDR